MKNSIEMELVVEILDQDQDWGRGEFIRLAREQGRELRVVSLGESHPPLDDPQGLWIDLKPHAQIANEAIANLYPHFLHEAAYSSGLLDITIMEDMVSIYWLMPISEMSSLRNPLIHKIYALFVLRSVLKGESFKRITLILNDPLIEKPARQMAEELGIESVEILKIAKKPLPYYRRRSALIWKWWRSFLYDLFYWSLLQFPEMRQPPDASERVLGLTIFPTLWDGNEKNRAYGDLPEELKRHGHGLYYLALPAMKLRDLLFSLKVWRKISARNRITFTYSQVQLVDLIHAYMRQGWGGRISRCLQDMNRQSYRIDGLDVSELLIREFLQETWEPAIPRGLLLARAAQTISGRLIDPAFALYAFEFQPIEKAFTLGLKRANPRIPVVGLQTSLIGQNHLGYRFLPQQVHATNEIRPPFVPLPDYVAAYGTVSYGMLKTLLGQERVELTGPVRYPYLKVDSIPARKIAEIELKKRLRLDPDTVPVLLALTSLSGESELVMKWALNIGCDAPGLFFLVRFHYWANLETRLKAYADRIGFDRFQIDAGDLHQQLMACRLIITGASSIGVEAMISGCIPLVYQGTGKYQVGPIADVRDGAFFFGNELELRMSILEAIGGGTEFQKRQARWRDLLERHCYGLDGHASQRLYNWLTSRGLFGNSLE